MFAVNEIHYLDMDGGSDANDGLSMSTAKGTFSGLWTYTGLSDGDVVMVRRGGTETMLSNLTCGNDPINYDLPIVWMCTPRPSIACTGDFTTDSNSILNVSGVTLSLSGHCTRLIAGPDDNNYMIQHVSGDTAILHKNYTGDTGTTSSFTIQADEYYDWYDTLASGEGRDVAAWDTDTHAMPTIDTATSYYLYNLSDIGLQLNNLYISNVRGNLCPMYINGSQTLLCGIYVACDGSSSAGFHVVNSKLDVNRMVWSNSGSSNGHITFKTSSASNIHLNYVAATELRGNDLFINMQGGTITGNEVTVNSYTTGADVSWAFRWQGQGNFNFENLIVENATTLIRSLSGYNIKNHLKASNYNQTSLAIQVHPAAGTITGNDGSGADVNLRVGGALQILDILLDTNTGYLGHRAEDSRKTEYAVEVFEHRIWQTSLTSKTYRYYVQSVTDALTSSDLWLEVEDVYGNITKSSDAITARTGAGDWGNWIEAACTQAVEGWVTLRVFCTKYSAVSHRYIDPQVEIY